MIFFIKISSLLVILNMCIFDVMAEECERDKSRTVRTIVNNELIYHYKALSTKMPYQCPFFKERDKYVAHEERKEREASTHWSCGYCGKSFIGEIYLDMHLSNRHHNTVYDMDDSVCLADYCEIFRCDVLSGVAVATFWDVALCMEEDMNDLSADCEDLMKTCVPETLNWNVSKALLSSLSKSVCSYLQCKTYYEAPTIEEKEPPGTGYIVGSVILLIFMILYYCVAVNYFWLDTFSDVYESDEPLTKHPNSLFDTEHKQKQKGHHKSHSRKKQSFIQTEAETNQDILHVQADLNNLAQTRSALNQDIVQGQSGLNTIAQTRTDLNQDIFQGQTGPNTSARTRSDLNQDIFQVHPGLNTSAHTETTSNQDNFQVHSGLNSSIQDVKDIS